MKKIVTLFAAIIALSGCSLLGSVNWNEEQLAAAMQAALTASSISDAQIIALCQQSVAEMDAKATLDNGTYLNRLKRLTQNVKIDGMNLNFKVYKTPEINAFACGDGSIRVYSGLMDVMDDGQLMAIIGHEIGHVVHKDTKRAMKKAYLTAAAAGLIGSAGSVGAIAAGTLGNIGQEFIQAQFSQKQEYDADDYGFGFAIQYGHDKYSMYSALNKLVSLSSSQSSSSKVAQMFASHPNSQERAAKMKAKADALQNK